MAGFGELLREHRQLAGLTQEELAEKAGISAHAISVLESGRRRPRITSVKQLVSALGVDAADRERLAAAARDDGTAPPEPAAAPLRPEVRDPAPRRTRLALRGLTHVLALVLGVGFGVALSHGAGQTPVGYPTEEQVCPPAPPGQSPVAGAPDGGTAAPGGSPGWVARPTADAQILSGTDVVLPVLTPVTAGDSLVVSIMLTATCPGRVTVTDTRGDSFAVVGDVTDSRHHRTLIIAGFHVHTLGTADSIHVEYPHASKYHVAVDEYRGISRATGSAQGFGESGGSAFSTGSARLDCAAGELLVGAVGANTGSEPVFTGEWHALPTLRLSSYRLATAYRVVPGAQSCAATGTTTAQWGAVAVAFR